MERVKRGRSVDIREQCERKIKRLKEDDGVTVK